jgi:hypothetical protein
VDEESGRRQNVGSYEKLSLVDQIDDGEGCHGDDFHDPLANDDGSEEDGDYDDDNDDNDRTALGRRYTKKHQATATATENSLPPSSSLAQTPLLWYRVLHQTLLPDSGISFRGYPIVEGTFTVKLLKFIVLTFLSIAVVHVIVGRFFSDRDRSLLLWHIWVYHGDLIVRDCVVFFLVGRMWRQRGVDALAWVGTAMLANVYFESQNFFSFLQHSVTLYEMHYVWPWELWTFVLVLVPTIGALVLAHVVRAVREGILQMKLMELALCVLFFVAPLAPSSYFHLHHWYAGWLLGMHANYDVWWSRLAMAWCWGMYVNGIAVYGRDPVLTCEYAYFLTVDNHCPYVNCYLEALKDLRDHPHNHTTHVQEMVPADWRNCSSDDYHP